jgi:hypothetical protein
MSLIFQGEAGCHIVEFDQTMPEDLVAGGRIALAREITAQLGHKENRSP